MRVSARGIALHVDLLANDRITWSWGRSLRPSGAKRNADYEICTQVHWGYSKSAKVEFTSWQISLKSPRLPSFCSVFFFVWWHHLCAEMCIFASSPLHCIMNASLSHAWKHMWQDGLFLTRCARFLSTCRGLRGGKRTQRGRMVRQYRRAKKRIKLKQSFVTISGKLNTFMRENN